MVSTFSNFVVWRSYEMFLYIFLVVCYLGRGLTVKWNICFSWCKLQSNVMSSFCIGVIYTEAIRPVQVQLIMSVREKQSNIFNLVPVMYVINTEQCASTMDYTGPIILNYSQLYCLTLYVISMSVTNSCKYSIYTFTRRPLMFINRECIFRLGDYNY